MRRYTLVRRRTPCAVGYAIVVASCNKQAFFNFILRRKDNDYRGKHFTRGSDRQSDLGLTANTSDLAWSQNGCQEGKSVDL